MVFPFRDPHVAPPDGVKWKMGPTLLGLPLSCVHAQTRFSCKRLRNNLADRPACSRKRRFRPQQFAQQNCVLSGLLSLHHPKRLAALRTAIAFPQSGRRLPALHKKLRRLHLMEGAELQNDHVAYAVGIDNLPTVSSPCSWKTTSTHAVMRSVESVVVGKVLFLTSVLTCRVGLLGRPICTLGGDVLPARAPPRAPPLALLACRAPPARWRPFCPGRRCPPVPAQAPLSSASN